MGSSPQAALSESKPCARSLRHRRGRVNLDHVEEGARRGEALAGEEEGLDNFLQNIFSCERLILICIFTLLIYYNNLATRNYQINYDIFEDFFKLCPKMLFYKIHFNILSFVRGSKIFSTLFIFAMNILQGNSRL
jgi:hypothetical protein